jgi:hypothetical protein
VLVIQREVKLPRLEQDMLCAFITFALDYLNVCCPAAIIIASDHTDVGGYLEDQASSGAAEMLKAFSYIFPPGVIYKPRE